MVVGHVHRAHCLAGDAPGQVLPETEGEAVTDSVPGKPPDHAVRDVLHQDALHALHAAVPLLNEGEAGLHEEDLGSIFSGAQPLSVEREA